MSGEWRWNPLSAWWLDSYSLAYTVSSLLNQLFGKGKEPFWQQAYTNLVRWIIELHRVLPENWVTLQQVYYCAIDQSFSRKKIKQAEAFSKKSIPARESSQMVFGAHKTRRCHKWAWTRTPTQAKAP